VPDLTEEMARLEKSLDAIEEDACRLFAKYPAPNELTAYPELPRGSGCEGNAQGARQSPGDVSGTVRAL
jgi:hypothetical protein